MGFLCVCKMTASDMELAQYNATIPAKHALLYCAALVTLLRLRMRNITDTYVLNMAYM